MKSRNHQIVEEVSPLKREKAFRNYNLQTNQIGSSPNDGYLSQAVNQTNSVNPSYYHTPQSHSKPSFSLQLL